MTDAILALADGTVFRGTSVGAPGTATGEVVFNTAMTGYQEIISDPSYAGQLITFTAPHIGNYGACSADDQADTIHAAGVLMRAPSRLASSWRSEETLTDYLTARGIVALGDIDTRRLTRRLARRGAMPAAIGVDIDAAELIAIAAAAPEMVGRPLALDVSTRQPYRSDPDGDRRAHVVAIDLGMKRDIVRAFNDRHAAVTVVPATTSPNEIRQLSPDGVFLSNGPGDPEPLSPVVDTVRALLGSVPIFGICLGHQVLGLALGATTYKLPFGHHGGNHPVRRIADGTVDITAQNHGFAVDLWSLTDTAPPEHTGLPRPDWEPRSLNTPFGVIDATHQNLNDGTNEGLACRDVVAYSVQYHPEAAPGPNDARKLFDAFTNQIGPHDAAT